MKVGDLVRNTYTHAVFSDGREKGIGVVLKMPEKHLKGPTAQQVLVATVNGPDYWWLAVTEVIA